MELYIVKMHIFPSIFLSYFPWAQQNEKELYIFPPSPLLNKKGKIWVLEAQIFSGPRCEWKAFCILTVQEVSWMDGVEVSEALKLREDWMSAFLDWE